MHEVIWYGRGGQGVVVAAQILAESAYFQGFKVVTSVPTFGPERRGAPLTASTRISDEPIRVFSQIEFADVAVVLDESLIQTVNVMGSLKEDGILIINTPMPADQVDIKGCRCIATVDAAGIALRHRLVRDGAPVVNTPLLGALSRATGLVSLEFLVNGLKHKLSGGVVETNILALRAAFEETTIRML